MAAPFRQDLPPEGGYPGINFTRAVFKQRFPGWAVTAGVLSMMAFGFAVCVQNNAERT